MKVLHMPTPKPPEERALRRCVSCFEPFVTEQSVSYGSRCSFCEREDRLRLEAWERSLTIQRAVRGR